MKRIPVYLLLVVGLGLSMSGCNDMHDQQSIKPQEAPRRTAPATAVPIQGKLIVSWQSQLTNNVPTSDTSVQRGEELFKINCVMCHGTRDDFPGKIGKKFVPPPPNLYDPRIVALSDGDIFKRISLGFGRMPAFQLEISVTDRWHLVNYLKTF